MHELSEEECFQRVFKSCSNELYEKLTSTRHHTSAEKPGSRSNLYLYSQIGAKTEWNCAFYGKSTKFGTVVVERILINFRYTATVVLLSDGDHSNLSFWVWHFI